MASSCQLYKLRKLMYEGYKMHFIRLDFKMMLVNEPKYLYPILESKHPFFPQESTPRARVPEAHAATSGP